MVSLLGRLSRARLTLNYSMISSEIRSCHNAILFRVPSPLSLWTMHQSIITRYGTIVCDKYLMCRSCSRCAMTLECFLSFYSLTRLIIIQLRKRSLNWSNGWRRITCWQVDTRVLMDSWTLHWYRWVENLEITSEVVILIFNALYRRFCTVDILCT